MAFDTTFIGIPTCQPAVLFLVFGLFFIIVDLLIGRFRRASVRGFQTALFVLFLHILCLGNMNSLGYILILFPFIIFTALVTLTLYAVFTKQTAAAEDAPISTTLADDQAAAQVIAQQQQNTTIEEESKTVATGISGQTIRLFGVRSI